MSELESEILTSLQNDVFLDVIYKNSLGEEKNREDLSEVLLKLHEEGTIDLVAEFRQLKSDNNKGHDFFLTRHVFEELLPRIDAPILPVMECVLRLASEAGQDMAAGAIFTAYVEFCTKDNVRPEDALGHIEKNIAQLADLLTPTIIAGSRLKTERYLEEAIRFANYEDLEIRRRALFSLGKFQFSQDSVLPEKALSQLESSVNKESDDHLLGSIIKSAFSLYEHDALLENRVTNLIDTALHKGDEAAIHAASEILGFDYKKITDSLLGILLLHLKAVNPDNKGTLDNIDFGLDKLLADKSSKAVDFIEGLLIKNSDNLPLETFDSVIRRLYQNDSGLLGRLLTRWFVNGERALCNGILDVIKHGHEHSIILSIEDDELPSRDLPYLLFIARKAIGYLFFYPVTAASVVVSLILRAEDDKARKALTSLLYDPLLINYPGKVQEYLEQHYKSFDQEAKEASNQAKSMFDKYLNDLKSTGVIAELHPSQSHRDAQRRHFSIQMSNSMKEAEKESVFLSLVSKSVLLYGRKSINYIYGSGDQPNRMEIPLQAHGTEIEFPRIQNIDPFGLDYMLRVFRAEKMGA